MLDEFKALIKNPKLIIIMVGISLVPALYNMAFLGSMWDPYGHVNELPIAVVNQDEPAYLNGKSLTIGHEMVDNMSKNGDLDYHFVSEETAKKGLKDGKYYMIITLPKELSKKATTLLDRRPEKLMISYQTSKGHGVVASKMGETAMAKLQKSISQKITKNYTLAVFASMTELQSGLKEAEIGSQKLAFGTATVQNGSQTITSNLTTLSGLSRQFAQGVNQLISGLSLYTGGVGQLTSGLDNLSTEMPIYFNGISRLSQGAAQLHQGLLQLTQATDISDGKFETMQTLTAGLPTLNQGIQQLNNSLSTVQFPSLNIVNLTTSLTVIRQVAQQIIAEESSSKNSQREALQETAAYQSLSPEQQAELSTALNQTDSMAASSAKRILENVQDLSVELKTLDEGISSLQLEQLKASLTQIATQSNQVLPETSAALIELSKGMAPLNTTLSLF
ncbi:YhgE/Pip domain-containing protein [Streptococcus castoreus]|uniref:YhgE/Pip domain-containing protein n=1 Tax=Streptococcus castoreus TaxID=254786 RepID=UPI00041571B2|nr:YhgE/Pip domain-containing protein [Streptococcus castoreus]